MTRPLLLAALVALASPALAQTSLRLVEPRALVAGSWSEVGGAPLATDAFEQLFVTVPGAGRYTVALEPFRGARRAGQFSGRTLAFTLDGRSVRLQSSEPILEASEPVFAYVRLDPEALAGSTVRVLLPTLERPEPPPTRPEPDPVLTAEADRLDTERDDIDAERRLLEARVARLRTARDAAAAERARILADLETLRRDSARFATDANTYDAERQRLLALQRQIEAEDTDHEALVAERERLRLEYERLAAEREALTAETDALEANIQTLTEDLATLRSQRDALTTEQERLSGQRDTEARESALQEDTARSAAREEVEILQAEVARLAAELERLRTAQDRPVRAAPPTDASYAQLRHRLDTITVERDGLTEAVSTLRRDRDRLAEQVRLLDAERLRLIADRARIATDREQLIRERDALHREAERLRNERPRTPQADTRSSDSSDTRETTSTVSLRDFDFGRLRNADAVRRSLERTTYPAEALAVGAEGEVLVLYVVDERGVVREATVARSLEASLDRVAEALVRSMRFQPARVEGTPTTVRGQVVVAFRP